MDKEIFEIAAKVLGMSIEEVQTNSKQVPEIDGYYFWYPSRGGIALLINSKKEKLGATSSVSFERHLQAFLAGKRN